MQPYSQAAEENKTVVLPVLEPRLKGVDQVLEIGSGTAEQIVYFAAQHPEVRWQASDLAANIPHIQARIADAALANLPDPVILDVSGDAWSSPPLQFVYTSNTLHIMSWQAVACLLRGCAERLVAGGHLCVYGPFILDGAPLCDSNIAFDQHLRERDPLSGIRDTAAMREVAEPLGLLLQEQIAMPHNNHVLIWQKR